VCRPHSTRPRPLIERARSAESGDTRPALDGRFDVKTPRVRAERSSRVGAARGGGLVVKQYELLCSRDLDEVEGGRRVQLSFSRGYDGTVVNSTARGACQSRYAPTGSPRLPTRRCRGSVADRCYAAAMQSASLAGIADRSPSWFLAAQGVPTGQNDPRPSPPTRITRLSEKRTRAYQVSTKIWTDAAGDPFALVRDGASGGVPTGFAASVIELGVHGADGCALDAGSRAGVARGGVV